ncbi:MAG: hypothetical protein HETSPECPRED_004891 [Heterodermia speciosa]|uniref:AB hydrolase-1 domain-containing protein n=1 Tax=Heterodermia speciosa TaxID=116794 RepID=A0A8H3EIG1_9LECA|nr:MAG: hypothetical protein HETSPECPRED_004891 [Heterodermia speciosa]
MPLISIPSGRTFYKDTPASDPSSSRGTLLLHHGLGSTHTYYQSIVPALTSPSYNFRCITYDCISCGLSSIATEAQSIESVAKDAIDLLDALKIEKAVFVGHSFAGVVAAHLAATKSDRIQATVMLGPVLPSGDVAKVFEARIKTIEEKGMEAMADTIPTGATGSKSTSLQHAFIRQLLLAQNPKGYQSMCKVVGTAKVPDYAAIQVANLIIAGDEDKSAPLAGCQEIHKRIGSHHKQFEVVQQMGHWHCIEAPDIMIKYIGKFVNDLV